MISFDNICNIPKHISKKISLPIVSSQNCNKIISCKVEWGMTNYQNIQDIISSYTNMNDKVIYIFLITDSVDTFNIPQNVRLYRTSLLKSKKHKNEHVLPYIWEGIDITFSPLKKVDGDIPIIGFCGLNSIYRNRTLELFSNNKNVKSNFIIRNKFWGGIPHDKTIIKEFQNNIFESHFNICNRGAGNFSMRFYQTLSAGRIPILLNTDMILPFEDEIKWNEIIVLGNTEEELVENVIYYWCNKNIIEMQIKCKEIYDTYFKDSIFFDKILSES